MHKRTLCVNVATALVALAAMFPVQPASAEVVVWELADHLDSIEEPRTNSVHCNKKTDEVSMRGPRGLKYNTMRFCPNVAIKKNMVVKFDVRREADLHQAVRFAVFIKTEDGNDYYQSDSINEDSKSFVFDLATLRNKEGKPFVEGDVINEFSIYTTNKKLDPDVDMNFAVRSFRFVIEKGDGPPIDYGIFYSVIPHFQWASADAEFQRLQYARTPSFTGRSLRDIKLDEPQYVPKENLKPGDWYWRYYRKDHLSDRWSDVYKFTVSKRAHRFRLPELDMKALAEKPHPRFAGLESVLLTDDLRERVVETVNTPIPADGVARRGSGMSKIDWLRTVCHVVVTPTWKRLDDYGQYLLATDDPAVKEAARERLLEVVKWDPEKASSELSNDLGAGNLLIAMSLLFDALYDALSPSEREEVMGSIEARCTQFADAGVVPMTLNPAQNHTWKKTEALGVGAMVLLGHREPARYWFESARNDFAYRFLPSMGFEGENQEGIAYWRYGGEMLAEFADILQAFSGDNLYEHEWLKNTVKMPIYSAPPGGYAISFADTSGDGNHTVRGPYALYKAGDFMAHLTKKTGFPYGNWYLGKSIPGAQDQRPPVDLEPFKHWEHIGWALFNTCLPNGYENVAVGLHAGKYFAGHQHADQNSFVINAYGDKLAIDGGAYDWYGSPHYKSYAIQTIAHNTILVNGKGQLWRKEGADGIIETFYSSIPYDYVKGDAADPDIYEGRLRYFKRKLLFIKPDYVMVHDQLVAAEKKAEFDWLLHSHTEKPIVFGNGEKAFSIVRPLARLDGQFLFPADVELDVRKSYTNLPCKIYSLEPRDPDKIPPDWTLSGNTKTKNSIREYFVVMRISRTTGEFQPLEAEKVETDNAFGAILRDGERVVQVLSRKGGKKGLLNFRDISTDADIACVELGEEGKLQSAFIGDGTQLKYAGTAILEKSAPVCAHFNAREEWKSRKLEPVRLLEGAAPFAAYAMQLPRDQQLFMYSGSVDVSSSNTIYEINLSGIDDPVYVHVAGQINPVPVSGRVSLDEGNWFMTVSSCSDLSKGSFKKVSE